MTQEKGTSVSSRAAKKGDTKKKMSALLSSIQAHTQAIASKTPTDPGPVSTEGLMFIDQTSYESDKDELVFLDPKDCYVEKQVREQIDHEKVIERRKSMEAHGQIKPITVMPRDDRGYKVQTGEYRWRAASIEPPMKIEAIIKRSDKSITEHKLILKQLAENTEAVPVTIYEIAMNLRRAMVTGNIESAIELAKQMGWHDPDRPDYGRTKVSQYLSLFNLCERGQRIYAAEKMNDIRAIKILSSIKSLSETSYNSILSMIEKGENVTRKMLESERDSLKIRLSETKEATQDAQGATSKSITDKPLRESQQKSSNLGKAGKTAINETVIKLPKIIFKYQLREVELQYEPAKAGKVICKLRGDPNDQILELDPEDIIFKRFEMPK